MYARCTRSFLSYSFLPTITLPTRLSNNSSRIDNIFVNKHERLIAGILNNEISDHEVIAVNMNLTLPPQKINYITVFSNSDQSKINFKNDFESKSVYDRLNHELDANPDENYSILESAISDMHQLVIFERSPREKNSKVQQKKTQRRPLDHIWYIEFSAS